MRFELKFPEEMHLASPHYELRVMFSRPIAFAHGDVLVIEIPDNALVPVDGHPESLAPECVIALDARQSAASQYFHRYLTAQRASEGGKKRGKR